MTGVQGPHGSEESRPIFSGAEDTVSAKDDVARRVADAAASATHKAPASTTTPKPLTGRFQDRTLLGTAKDMLRFVSGGALFSDKKPVESSSSDIMRDMHAKLDKEIKATREAADEGKWEFVTEEDWNPEFVKEASKETKGGVDAVLKKRKNRGPLGGHDVHKPE